MDTPRVRSLRTRLRRAAALFGPSLMCLLSVGALAAPAADGASAPATVWTDPSYGLWHSCVIGGGGYLLSTVICPSDPKRLYVYGDMDGLFRSDDGGKTWRIIHGGMDVPQGRYEFAGIAVNPKNADDIAVACGSQETLDAGGVFVSGDGGKTWAKTLSAHFMGNGPFRWAGSRIGTSVTGKVIVAASEGTGVWRSGDGGRTWQDCGMKGVFFTDVVFDRTDPRRVWLCAAPVQLSSSPSGKLSGGAYRSDDGGKTWVNLTGDSPFEISQDPVRAHVLYGLCDTTVKRSVDLGATWQDFSQGLPGTPNAPGTDPFRAIGAGPDFTVIMRVDTKMIYRLDSGRSQWQAITPVFSLTGWRIRFTPPPANDASSITVSPGDRSHWYLTDEFGLYQSWDSGHTWTPSDQGIETTVIHTLAQDPANASHIYLGAADVGFWWSSDTGVTLNQTDSSSAGWVGNIKCIDASSTTPSRVYAVGGEGWTSNRIYRSTDGGRRVSQLTMRGTGLPDGAYACDSIAVAPHHPDSVYLATSTVIGATSGGVYHSADGGASWTWAGAGLPLGKTVFNEDIWWGGRELAMGSDGTLLAISARCGGAFRYDTSRGAWAALNLPAVGGIYSVVADHLTPGRFYVCEVGNDAQAGTTDGGLFRSDDDGAHWKSVLPGSVHAVACDEGVKNRLAASRPDGVYLSVDGGGTWTKLAPLPNHWFNDSLAFAGNHLLAGTGGNGAFWIDLREADLAQAK